MDREIWCTSGLRIRTWEIGTAGTRNGEGGKGTAGTYLFSTPVQTPSWRYVSTYHSAARPARQGEEGQCQGSPGSAY